MTNLTQSSLEEAFKSDEDLQKTANLIAKDISNGVCDICEFLEKLGFALTSTNVSDRVNGVRLCSATLQLLPKDALNAKQLESLMTFYALRSNDHHNCIPAIIDGIDALVNMTNCPADKVPEVVTTFCSHVSCQSQTHSDRGKLYKIFQYISGRYTEVLKAMKGDYIYIVINAMEGERDPRNLDFMFTSMPQFIATFPLEHLAEEMFETFACYFPIDFNPSKNDPDTITRDNLADKLKDCLTASPDFAEFTVALAIEKLDTDLVVAKLDSLRLLQQAAAKFPAPLMEPYFDTIWTTLKPLIYPGGDNVELIREGLSVLQALLAAATSSISHNYQTVVFGTILPHLSDVTDRLFQASTAIALVCFAIDPAFGSDKIFTTFLMMLGQASNSQRVQIFSIVGKMFYIAGSKEKLQGQIPPELTQKIHTSVFAVLRPLVDTEDRDNIDLIEESLRVFSESCPLVSEPDRVLLYKLLEQLVFSESLDLPCAELIERLGALHPVELQSNFLNGCISKFPEASNHVKEKIYRNLLPLLKQMAFTERVLDLIFSFAFREGTASDVRLLALQALNRVLQEQDGKFVEDLQQHNNLIEKLVNLPRVAVEPPLNIDNLEQVALSLSTIIQLLPVAEQYAIVTEYLDSLDLQTAAGLFTAKGLLGFLHKDISLDDHFERLVDDLTSLSLHSDDERMREVAHHLLCSLMNKIDHRPEANRTVVRKVLHKLKQEIAKGDAKAVEALAWLGKGLIRRGFEDEGEIVEQLATLLDHPTLGAAAALAFDIISTEFPQLHLPVVKYLYQQKFFHTILTKLGHKVEEFCEHHFNAFIYVLKATPHAVLKMNMEKIGPILFKSLEAHNERTVILALDICERFVQKQDEYFRAHLHHLIPSFVHLTVFPDTKVRLKSLLLLTELTKYPTFTLLPHKTDLLLSLAAVMDDKKRTVRAAAVQARNEWYMVGAPGAEES